MAFNAFFTILLVAVLLFNATFAYAQYEVNEARLTVYRDGVVRVEVKASVSEVEPSITLPLLSSSVYNVLAVDENAETLNYDVNPLNITVYTLGAKALTLEYDTDSLTRKEAGLWTLTFNAPFNLKVLLPEGSTITYLSSPPTSIRIVDGRIELTVERGSWEIGYELPVTPLPKPIPVPPPQPSQWMPLTVAVGTLIIVVTGVTMSIALIKRRRRRPALMMEEEAIIRFLKERGGRALEVELREAFPHIPRTSMWRLVRRLEKMGRVKVRKVGLQNVVELK
ncbi:MAG: hypothetical protein QXK12_08545 [Candidatus Nezhaarchaeales archaeon]